MSRNSSSGISTSFCDFIIQVMKKRKCMFSRESSNNIEPDAPSTLRGSRSTLTDSPSTLSDARSTLSGARSTLSDARFTLSDARFTLNDSPSTLSGSRSSILCSRSSILCSRSYFNNFRLLNEGVHHSANVVHL